MKTKSLSHHNCPRADRRREGAGGRAERRMDRRRGSGCHENEPKIEEGLMNLPNVVLCPHIASATEETRDKMATNGCE